MFETRKRSGPNLYVVLLAALRVSELCSHPADDFQGFLKGWKKFQETAPPSTGSPDTNVNPPKWFTDLIEHLVTAEECVDLEPPAWGSAAGKGRRS